MNHQWTQPLQVTCLNLYRSLDFSWKLSLSSSPCRFSMNVSLLRKFLMTQWGKGWQSNSRSPAHTEQRAAWRRPGVNHFLLEQHAIDPVTFWNTEAWQFRADMMARLFILLFVCVCLCVSDKEFALGELIVFSLRTLAVVSSLAPRLLQILLQLLVLEQRAQLGRFFTALLFLLFCYVSRAPSSFGCHCTKFPNRKHKEFKVIHQNDSLCWRRGKALLSHSDDVSVPQLTFPRKKTHRLKKFFFNRFT